MSAQVFIHYYLSVLLAVVFGALLASAVWLISGPLQGAMFTFIAMWTPIGLFAAWKNIESARELARWRR